MGTDTTNTYSISELQELTDIPVRTIRFYIKEGVVAPPIGTGGGAKYTELHLLQLQVTKVLQERHHLKLEGIRQVLKGKSVEVLKQTLLEAETGNRGWDDETLHSWIAPHAAAEERLQSPRNFSFANISSITTPPPAAAGNIFNTLRRETTSPAPQSWQRFAVIDGVELNIREDVPAQTREQIINLLVQLRR